MNEEENELILAQDKAQDKAQDEIVNEKISNMNEEEKQAIEKFSNLMTKHFEDKKIDTSDYLDYFEAITILNLIEKQQKEIEELKSKLTNDFISKDKIKEKIDEITKEYFELFEEKRSLDFMNINGHRYNAMKLVLEELLGE